MVSGLKKPCSVHFTMAVFEGCSLLQAILYYIIQRKIGSFYIILHSSKDSKEKRVPNIHESDWICPTLQLLIFWKHLLWSMAGGGVSSNSLPGRQFEQTKPQRAEGQERAGRWTLNSLNILKWLMLGRRWRCCDMLV